MFLAALLSLPLDGRPAGATEGSTTVLSSSDSAVERLAESVPFAGGPGFASVSDFAPVSDRTIASLAATVPTGEHSGRHTRQVASIAHALLVGDMFKTDDAVIWVATLVDSTGALPPRKIVELSAERQADGSIAAVADFLDEARSTLVRPSTAASGPCYQLDCALLGTATGVLGVPACGVIAYGLSLSPVPGGGVISGMICAAVFIMFGVGAGTYCGARGEDTSCLQPVAGFFPQDVDCGYSSCYVKAQVAPRGRALLDTQLRLWWTGLYPNYNSECDCDPVAYANYFTLDGPYPSFYPTAYQYERHGQGTPADWVRCTHKVDIYVGFLFADGSFASQETYGNQKPNDIGVDYGCLH